MLLPENLQVFRPQNIEDTFKLVESFLANQSDFKFLAGGTDVIAELKGNYQYKGLKIISLKGLSELNTVELVDNQVKIGALATLADLVTNPLILKHVPIISKVARQVASPQIRNQATAGGNLLVNNRCDYYNQGTLFKQSFGGPCFKAGGDRCYVV